MILLSDPLDPQQINMNFDTLRTSPPPAGSVGVAQLAGDTLGYFTQFKKDAAGNVIGLIGSGKTAPLAFSPRQQLLTVLCGNSISAQNQWNAGGYWQTNAEIHIANMLCGSGMRFPKLTASTRLDRCGVYGYSGATLTTINADIAANWFAPLASAGIVPEMASGFALLENDIAQGHTVAAMTADLTQWIRTVQNTWPGVIIHLCTPRPAFTYNTPSIVAAYQAMRDYILSLDDGLTIFVTRLDAYEDPANPGMPLSITANGSNTGSVLTISAPSGTVTSGQYVFGTGVTPQKIVSLGTGTGGAGTYNLVGSPAITGTVPIQISPYTDNAVHPQAKGAWVNARLIAATILRISPTFANKYANASTNLALIGTGAASGTNVSGTVPTSAAINGSANATYVAAANQPGFTQTISGLATASSGQPPPDLSTFNFGSLSLSASIQIAPYIVIKIISGAENLRNLELLPRVNDGGGNTFQYFIQDQTGDGEPDFKNGDILTIRVPQLIANSGVITACTIYALAKSKLVQAGTAQFSFQVLSQGVGLVPVALSGTSASIGGSALTAGQRASATVAIPGATTGMAVEVSPAADPGAGFCWNGYVSSAGVVTVVVDCILAGTPTATTYNVRVIQ